MTELQPRFTIVNCSRSGLKDQPFPSSGALHFTYDISPGHRLNIGDSYVFIKLKLIKSTNWFFVGDDGEIDPTNNSLSTLESRDGIVQNAFCALFNSCEVYIQDKKVHFIDSFSQAITQLRYCYETGGSELSDMSPIIPYEYAEDTAYQDENDMSNAKTQFINARLRAMNAEVYSRIQRVYRASPFLISNSYSPPTAKELDIVVGMPLSYLFLQIHDGPNLNDLYSCRVTFSFQVNPDAKKAIFIESVDMGVNPIVERSTCEIKCMSEFFMYLKVYENIERPIENMNFVSRFKKITTVRQLCSSNSNFVNVPNCETILISFHYPNALSYVDNNEPRCFFNNADRLQTLSIIYQGRTYPESGYNFNSDNQDIMRAYMDYKVYTLIHTENSQAPLTLREWIQSPIFVFKVLSDTKSSSNRLQYSVTKGGTKLEKMDIVITCLSNALLEMKYNENGICPSENVSVFDDMRI